MVQFNSVAQSCPTLCNPMDAACQASLSITNSRSLLTLMSFESVMPSNHLILCRPLLLLPQSPPASGSFLISQFFTSGGQSIGVSASALVLPMNIQNWFKWILFNGWVILHLLFNMLSRLVVIFLPRSKCILTPWLQSPSAVILEPTKIKSDSFHCFPIYFPWSNGTGCHDLRFLNVEL